MRTTTEFPLYAVSVREPWPSPILLVPQTTSTVQFNCTISDSPLWSINLANDSSKLQDQFSSRGTKLNAHGLYELPQIETPGMPPTLRLLINNTAWNNQTVIYCSGEQSHDFKTTLFVFGTLLTLCCADQLHFTIIH